MINGEQELLGGYDGKRKIWYGPSISIGIDENLSLTQVALGALRKVPERVLQINDANGRSLTAQEMDSLTSKIADNLERLGIEQEDVVGICASNTDYVTPLILAIWANGAISSSMDPSFDRVALTHFYGITKPKLMFCDGRIYDQIKDVISELDLDCPIYTLDDHREGVASIGDLLHSTTNGGSYVPKALIKGGNQTAAICASSGTGGKQKGVCISHKALLESACLLTTPNKRRVFIYTTIFWLSYLYNMMASTLCNFTRIITNAPFTPELTVRLIEKYQITDIYLSVPLWMKILQSTALQNSDLTSVTAFRFGGSPIPTALVEKLSQFMDRSKMFATYGMTELVSICSVGQLDRPNIVGKILPNVEVCIMDDRRNCLGPEQRGEICARTHHQWLGYYNDPIQTTKTLDEQGWIHTGDLGYFDNERNLYIVDRLKEIFKYHVYQVSPSELENFILTIPGVSEACVAPTQDEHLMNLPAVVIVREPGNMLDQKTVFNAVALKFPNSHRLRGGVYFAKDIPQTATGKYLRREVVCFVDLMRRKLLE